MLLNEDILKEKQYYCKDLSRVKAGFKRVPVQPNLKFPATFWYWLAQRFQNKVEEGGF